MRVRRVVERAISQGLDAQGFEPGSDYATYAKEVKGLPVQNCGWQDFALDAPVDAVTTFHVFEHLLDPMSAVAAVTSWLKEDGYFYIEVPNAKNGLELKGYGSLHMAHTHGFARYSIELVDSQTKCKFCTNTESCMEYEEWEVTTVT